MLNTDNWASFPFSVNGVNFVSKIDTTGSFYPALSKMPTAMVDMINTQAITELVGDPTLGYYQRRRFAGASLPSLKMSVG